MRRVPKAIARPNVCVVFPHLPHDHEAGFFDPGNDLTCIDPHPYVSVVAAEHMARELGWVPPEEQQAAEDRILLLTEQLEAANVRASGAEAKLAAIDVIESEGFRARKKPGRKPEPKVEVAA